MIFNGVIQSLLVFIAIKVVTCENQRCYVCIPNIGSSITDVIDMFPSGPSIPLCNGFEQLKKEYYRECPSAKHVGCLTQTNGTHTTKSCSAIGVHDCKTANGIKYCYCTGDLCNNESVPEEEARPALTLASRDDDEDTEPYMEGSGSSEESGRGKMKPKTLVTTGADDIAIDGTSHPTPPVIKSVNTDKAQSSSSTPKSIAPLYLLTFPFVFKLIYLRLFCCD